jgi:hypothetical protein
VDPYAKALADGVNVLRMPQHGSAKSRWARRLAMVLNEAFAEK